MTRFHRVRRGFTLVELLVAMGVILVLTGLALVVVPGILDQDRTTDAAGLTRQWLMISKNRAGRDGLPRGVRLIVAADPNNPNKSSPYFVTELQYTEMPPVLVPNPLNGILANPPFTPFDPNSAPYVALFYGATGAAGTAPNQVGIGALRAQACEIRNLTYDQAVQVIPGSIIALPTIGTWHRVTNAPTPVPQSALGAMIPGGRSTLFTVQVDFDQFPDAVLGAASTAPGTPPTPSWISFHFGVYGAPRPLLGEPLLQLPKNTCIDLTPFVSRPGAAGPAQDYDIVFAPSGQVIFRAEGQINLWVRDYMKVRDMTPLTPNAGTPPASLVAPYTYDVSRQQFQLGGEQQIVAIKTRSGSLGVFPVYWPNMTTGQYLLGQDPYYYATQGATAP